MTESDDEGLGTRINTEASETEASVEQLAWVGETATIRGAIDLDIDNVIGIFGKFPDLRAFLRGRDGSILRVKVGDSVFGGRVQGIDKSSVVIAKDEKIIRLRLSKKEGDTLFSLLQ